MMHFTKLALGAIVAAASLLAHADTPEQARTLLDAAVAEAKAKGLDGAAKEFNAGGKWKQGQMYIVMANFDGLMLAHSANDKIPGKNMLEAKDAAGKSFVKETIANVKASGNSQIELRWGNPVTKQIGDASMYAKGVPGQDLYVGSIVFK